MGDSLLHPQLRKRLIGVYYDVYWELGYGFLERVYQRAFGVALGEQGLRFVAQAPIAVAYHDTPVGQYFADFLVEAAVIVELKACRSIEQAHESQLLNYLRATEVEVGPLLNFGERPAFRRLVFSNERKNGRETRRTRG